MLRINDGGVALSGRALQPPTCATTQSCRASQFDFEAGACLESTLADGTDCTSSFACFAAAVCSGGTCRGTTTTCADSDRCTIDACGEAGCFHASGVFECPAPTNPCAAEACDPALGCGTQPVPDGTACGTRDCASAEVCISGQCAVRAAPQTQACVEDVVGIAGGCGDADGPGAIARFSQLAGLAVNRSTGVLYVADRQTIKRIAPSGVVSTFAGRNDGLFTPWRDGVGTNARFESPIEGLAVDSRGNLFVVGAGPLRKISPSGLVTTTSFAGGGQGISVAPDDSLWMVVGGSNVPSTLVHLSSLGQPLASMPLALGVRGVAVTAAGRIFVSGAPNAALSELLPDGGLETKVGDRVVLPDGGQMSFATPSLGGLTPDGRSIVLYGGNGAWRGVALFDLDGALRSVTEVTSLVGTIDNAYWAGLARSSQLSMQGAMAFQLMSTYLYTLSQVGAMAAILLSAWRTRT